MNRATLCSMLLLMTGCSMMQTVNTPSGGPEIVINAPKKAIIDKIADIYSRGGYEIKTSNDYTLVVERPQQSMAANVLLGSRMSDSAVRVTLLFAQAGVGVLIRARVEGVINPGTGFERRVDLTGRAQDLQDSFVKLKSEMESGSGQL